MTTRLDDELAVPHFKDQLWRELEKLHGSPGDVDPAVRARMDRRPRLLVAAAVVAIGGAVAGTVLLGERDDRTTIMTPAGQSTTTADVTTTEPTRPNEVVMIEYRNAEGHVHRSWVDEQTGLKRDLDLDAAGNPEWDTGWLSLREVGDEVVIVTREVDHCFEEYEDSELRVPIETARGDGGRPSVPEAIGVGGRPP